MGIKKISVKKIVIISIISVIILSVVVIVSTYFLNTRFREWADFNVLRKEMHRDDVASIEYNSDANIEVCAYDRYLGLLSKNEFIIYNGSGKEENKMEIPINNVIFNSSGRFLGIAEKEGQRIYLISGQNMSWEDKVEGNISKICVNKNGYMAVVISDTSYKSVVSLYNPNGKELFKIYLSSTRVSEITISNDNKYLALAEIDTTSSVIKSNVKVISIENAQTDTDNSIEYIHNAENGKLLTNIKYQEGNRLICMYDDTIDIIYNEENTELLNFSNRKLSFTTIEMNNNIAIIEEKSSGLFTADSEITLINTQDKKENMYTVEDVTKEIYSKRRCFSFESGIRASLYR